MDEHDSKVRDVARLEVARVGRVEETGDRLMPFRLLDHQGVEVAAVTRVRDDTFTIGGDSQLPRPSGRLMHVKGAFRLG